MFEGIRRKKGQRIMDAIGMIKPTSKASLKQTCLFLANLDVERAERMYDFLVKDMEEIPAVDPASKPFLANLGEQASGVLGWIRENQDILAQGVDLVRGVIGKKGPQGAAPLPPINP